jgi:cytochrome c oxidase subunit 2
MLPEGAPRRFVVRRAAGRKLKDLAEGVDATMRTWVLRFFALAIVLTSALAVTTAAFAALGHPVPWQIGFQDSATPVMDELEWFHGYVMVIITIITLFVLGLLIAVIVKFNARANPVPSKTTHNTALEIAWTLIPILILVSIAVPSFKLLFHQLNIPKADLTIKATGKQWYWSYSYPDNGKFEFDSILVQDKDLKPGQPRLLTADNAMVVPVNKVVVVQTTGADVIHSFAVPSFGIKIDAVPGRLNETWFKATKEGVYYGQCSELCGKNHAFMPIEVHVVSEQAFTAWVADAKKKFASDSTPPSTALAAAQ